MPGLNAPPVLLVVLPVAFVPGSLGVDVHPVAVALVVVPVALVHVAVGVVEPALALGHAVGPLALEHGPVRPTHGAVAVPEAAHPLSAVDRLAFVAVRAHRGLAWLEIPVQSLPRLLLREILAGHLRNK